MFALRASLWILSSGESWMCWTAQGMQTPQKAFVCCLCLWKLSSFRYVVGELPSRPAQVSHIASRYPAARTVLGPVTGTSTSGRKRPPPTWWQTRWRRMPLHPCMQGSLRTSSEIFRNSLPFICGLGAGLAVARCSEIVAGLSYLQPIASTFKTSHAGH